MFNNGTTQSARFRRYPIVMISRLRVKEGKHTGSWCTHSWFGWGGRRSLGLPADGQYIELAPSSSISSWLLLITDPGPTCNRVYKCTQTASNVCVIFFQIVYHLPAAYCGFPYTFNKLSKYWIPGLFITEQPISSSICFQRCIRSCNSCVISVNDVLKIEESLIFSQYKI